MVVYSYPIFYPGVTVKIQYKDNVKKYVINNMYIENNNQIQKKFDK